MLDIGFHQAAGLHSFTPQSELRVVAVASQDNAGTGLETLWQICASLQRLGYLAVTATYDNLHGSSCASLSGTPTLSFSDSTGGPSSCQSMASCASSQRMQRSAPGL